MRSRHIIYLALAAAACLGCDDGDDGSDGGPGGGGGISLDQVSAAYASSFCGYAIRCAGPTFEFFLGPIFGISHPDDCESVMAARFGQSMVAHAQAGVEAGRVVYDGDNAAACLAAMDSASCDAFGQDNDIEACELTFQGQIEAGEDCTDIVECAGDSFCNYGENACPGICAPALAAGEPCDPEFAVCANGLECLHGDLDSETGDQEEPTCKVAPEDEGEENALNPDNFTAAMGEACLIPADDLPPIEGDPMTFCADGLSCQVTGFSGATMSLTTECVARVAPGESCGAAFPDMCEGGICETPEDNPLMGTCAADLAEGEECAMGGALFGFPACARGFICIPSGESREDGWQLGTCLTMANMGEACTHETQCYSNHCDGGNCGLPPCGTNDFL